MYSLEILVEDKREVFLEEVLFESGFKERVGVISRSNFMSKGIDRKRIVFGGIRGCLVFVLSIRLRREKYRGDWKDRNI